MNNLLTKIAAALLAPIFFIQGLFAPTISTQAPMGPVVQNVGAALPQATGVFETSLVAPITATATTMTLTANAVRGGGSISGYTCFTVDEGTAQAEVMCGTVSGTAVSAMTRGISYADGITSVTANKFTHRRGADVKITDFPLIQIIKAQNNGDFTFPNALSYDGGITCASSTQLCPKSYVDGVAIAGAPDSSTTVKGIGKVSVAPVSPTSPIFVGDNDTRVPTVNTSSLTSGQLAALPGNNTDIAVGSGNKYVTQTGTEHNAEKYAVDNSASSTAYTVALSPIPTSLTDGMVVYAKIVNANTNTTPTLNVNSLTAHTIVKGLGTALAVGDIGANSLNTFIYDLTNTRWVLQNPVANPPVSYTNGTTTYDISTASGTQNIAHGLGKLPKKIRLMFDNNQAPATSAPNGQATLVYNGTTSSVVGHIWLSNGSTFNDMNSSGNIKLYSTAGGSDNTTFATGIVTFDATNIIITWTKTSIPTGTYAILWEAES